MTLVFACEVVLAGLLVAIATWTIVARTAFAAIVLFMVYGLLLAIVWVALFRSRRGIDGSCNRGRRYEHAPHGRGHEIATPTTPVADVSLPLRIAAGLLCALVTTVLGVVVFFLPDVGQRLLH